jgi:mono/diheme cytochrome c family protein
MTQEKAGQEVFRSFCAVCHGADAKGNGPAAPGLKRHPPDLTQLSRKNNGKFPTEIVSSIIQGNDLVTEHGTREMPMWEDAFRAMDGAQITVQLKIRNLTAYIESIQQRN